MEYNPDVFVFTNGESIAYRRSQCPPKKLDSDWPFTLICGASAFSLSHTHTRATARFRRPVAYALPRLSIGTYLPWDTGMQPVWAVQAFAYAVKVLTCVTYLPVDVLMAPDRGRPQEYEARQWGSAARRAA
eukprot:scaffold5941_cov125-Isochrysis_galbana.AAC.17